MTQLKKNMTQLVPTFLCKSSLKFSSVCKPSTRYFSTSAKKSSVWPGTYISVTIITSYLALGIGTLTSLAVIGLFLINGPSGGLEAEFFHALNVFITDITGITTTMVNRLTGPYTELDLRAIIDILRGIIPILQQILESANGVLESIDSMGGLYDYAFDQATELQRLIGRLLFVYRRIEAELGILPEETDLVPDPSEEDFYAAYVLALTGQGI